MKVLKLVAENFKRLSVVEIAPEGSLVQISGKNDQGKQQPVSEPILTPAGWKPIGNLRVGDLVIGSDGRPTEVTGIFPQSDRRTYLVKLYDGGSTRCGPDHLWTVTWWGSKEGEFDRITDTITTTELLKRGLWKDTHRKFALPIVGPVEFAGLRENLPIDPYTLGVILGDGHIEPTGYVTVSSWDEEIFSSLNVDGWRNPTTLGSGLWSRPLTHLGLAGKRSWEKFVPEIYLRASIAERKSLLAGLLDTDGYPGDSWAFFDSTSEQLIDAVMALGLSLGYVCKRRSNGHKTYRYKGELKSGRLSWRVTIKSPESPFQS